MILQGATNQGIVLFKKSPIVIVRNFLILQAITAASYVVASRLAYYARIYRSLFIAHLISFEIAQVLFIFSIETAMVFFIFFRWHKEYFLISPKKILHGWGIVYRHKKSIFLTDIFEVSYRQGLLGRLAKHGTLMFKHKISKKTFRFSHIPTPQKYADIIGRYKQGIYPISRVSTAFTPVAIQDLLQRGEGEALEFKSSLRWDMRAEKVNHELEKSVMKTIAAFLNSYGGHVIIGVDDAKNIIGVQKDYLSLRKRNADGFENHFSHIFHNMIGSEFRQLVHLRWHHIEGRECCVITVLPSIHPVYLRNNNQEEFYVRTGNGTTSLKFSEAAAHINARQNSI